MRNIDIGCFVEDNTTIEQGYRPGIIALRGGGSVIVLYMPLDNPLPKLQELRDEVPAANRRYPSGALQDRTDTGCTGRHPGR